MAVVAAEYRGYYSWNWGAGSKGPPNANTGCAFTGLIDVKQAIDGYTPGAAWCCPILIGSKWITLGGGNAAGVFTSSALLDMAGQAETIKTAGYNGVMFDVEEVTGSAVSVIPAFTKAFAAMKAAGLSVGVTTSHSAPYACDTPQDAVAFVKAWVQDSNIDVLSPQLYSSGSEGAPEFAETSSCVDAGCTWALYKGCKGIFAPSIVTDSQYAAVQAYFNDTARGIPVGGFFEWAQSH